MGYSLVPYISQAEIAAAVQQLAKQIDQDYAGQSLVIVAVLKGAFVFVADLVRQLRSPIQRIELLRLSSYGAATTSSGQVQVLVGLDAAAIAQQPVLLVEDIVDTGRSTAVALNLLRDCYPASVKLCSLLDKPARRTTPVQIDYLGITVEDRFIVGYGLDWNERHRELPAIYAVKQESATAVEGRLDSAK